MARYSEIVTHQPRKAKDSSEKPKKTKLLTLGLIAAVLLVLGILAMVYGKPLIDLFSDPERARAVIADAGPLGPLVFIGMQIAQVFFAPIPGQVTGFLSGFLFGTFWGTVYTMIGAAIGFTLIFVLARKLGRPFVEYFVDEKTLKKFDYLSDTKGVAVLFLIFLLPAFPDDIICYIAGLTNIKIRTLIIISLLGRLPGNLALNFAGSGVAESNVQLVVIVVSILLIISAAAYWKRKKIEAFVKRFSKQ